MNELEKAAEVQQIIDKNLSQISFCVPNLEGQKFAYKLGFVDSLNWQKERSYSEEDLKNAFNAGGMAANNKFLTWDDWFNQNKKK